MKTSEEGSLAFGHFNYDHTRYTEGRFTHPVQIHPDQVIPLENERREGEIKIFRLKLRKALSGVIYDFFKKNKNKPNFIDMLFEQFAFEEDFTSKNELERKRELLNYYIMELALCLEDTNLGIIEVINRLNVLGILKDEFNPLKDQEFLALVILGERDRIQSGLEEKMEDLDEDLSAVSTATTRFAVIKLRILNLARAAVSFLS